jgi:hypothetical protein
MLDPDCGHVAAMAEVGLAVGLGVLCVTSVALAPCNHRFAKVRAHGLFEFERLSPPGSRRA